ncbi:MAG: DUF998 domain-containing protein [Nitrospinota bacterium]|nr:DUF998 domain-containing protein [Nitrospinota bacterium]
MNPILKQSWLWLIIIALYASGCTRIFENDQDVQARQAMQDLMAIQEQFHKENQRYAKNLVEIQKYNLKYHTGIVYLEIESADKNKYRAISLPAESTTARVFAYDTDKGGFYEMGDEEVAQYVLGALNHIRKEQREKAIFDYLSIGMLICLFWFGLRMFARNKGQRSGWVWGPYFFCLAPLALAVTVLNHMDRNTSLSSDLLIIMGTGFGVSVICLILSGVGMAKIPSQRDYPILMGIAICTIIISLFNGFVLFNSYQTYSQPKTNNTLYFKEAR